RLGPLAPHQCWILALASGLAEEAFFRGGLQPAVGLVAASLLFAAAHFVPRRDLAPWSAFSLAAGLPLGWVYQARGNLTPPGVERVPGPAARHPRGAGGGEREGVGVPRERRGAEAGPAGPAPGGGAHAGRCGRRGGARRGAGRPPPGSRCGPASGRRRSGART